MNIGTYVWNETTTDGDQEESRFSLARASTISTITVTFIERVSSNHQTKEQPPPPTTTNCLSVWLEWYWVVMTISVDDELQLYCTHARVGHERQRFTKISITIPQESPEANPSGSKWCILKHSVSRKKKKEKENKQYLQSYHSIFYNIFLNLYLHFPSFI